MQTTLWSEWRSKMRTSLQVLQKAFENRFYSDDSIKSVHTPEETINVFKQLQPLLSKHGFKLKKWIGICKWPKKSLRICDWSPTQSKWEWTLVQSIRPCLEISGLLLRGVWKFADVIEEKNLKPQSPRWRSCLLFLQCSIHLNYFHHSVYKRDSWRASEQKNRQHWDNLVESNEGEEFIKWKDQLPEVAETSCGRSYFSTAKNTVQLHVFADA